MCTHHLLGDGLPCVNTAPHTSGHVYHSPGGDLAGQEAHGEDR